MPQTKTRTRTKAAPRRGKPKIGVDEFLAVARRFGFSKDAIARITEAVSDDDLPPGGASLCRYYCADPKLAAGPKLEEAAKKLFGVKYVYPTSSGTGALHAAFAAVGVGPGKEVICPALGFVATAGAAAMAGGVPVFSDVDESLHLDPKKIEDKITPRTVAIAPTHHWGGVAEMGPILQVARKHNLKVVEDCAQSPGASWRGKPVGTLGDVGCFSISAYKIVGAGEGGMLVTNSLELYERACQLAEFGGLWRPNRFADPRHEGELFVGTNYRMSDIEAAMNVVQLRKLSAVVKGYRAARQRLVRHLKTFRQIRPQTVNDPDGQVGYQLRFFPETPELGRTIAAALSEAGVRAGCRGKDHWPDWHCSAYMFPVTLKTSHVPGGSVFEDPRYLAAGGKAEYDADDCPVARDLFAREVSVGISASWTADDCKRVAATINRVLAEHCDEDPDAKGWA